ncbi:hypothetical protein OG689_41545 [Kitasatospora sp. NBC_00240]|uniref:Uncharacterized protein n=1 Tax=Kitasatospora herbaricolor TaxID=68217 RepID=A0ABZ1WLM3_9ACTN|nr:MULTISPECIES: hypothetical protein [Kitasatospora]MCX5215642.1 hypothetical protein [Kitasatospora sp. NBC_00240]
MHVSPEPITTLEEAAQEREKLLDFFARGLCCAVAHGASADLAEPGEDALAQAKVLADDYLAAYEEWLVQLAARNAEEDPQ